MVGQSERILIEGRESTGGGLSYYATGLPSGFSINGATGLISGTAKRAGASNVTVTAADSSLVSGQTTFRWTIGGLPSASDGRLAGLAGASPTLSFKLAAGRDAPPIASVEVALPGGLSFARSQRVVTRSIRVSGPGGRQITFAAKLSHGELTIVTGSNPSALRITIEAPAIRARAEVAAMAGQGTHRTLDAAVEPTDASDFTTALVVKLRL